MISPWVRYYHFKASSTQARGFPRYDLLTSKMTETGAGARERKSGASTSERESTFLRLMSCQKSTLIAGLWNVKRE